MFAEGYWGEICISANNECFTLTGHQARFPSPVLHPVLFPFLQSTSRIFLLTNNNLLLADQKSGQIKSEVPLVDVTKVSMSSQNDGFFAIHLKEVRRPAGLTERVRPRSALSAIGGTCPEPERSCCRKTPCSSS